MVSVGIDATIRQWSLLPDDLRKSVDQAKSTGVKLEDEKTSLGPVLTEEEERELVELIDE